MKLYMVPVVYWMPVIAEEAHAGEEIVMDLPIEELTAHPGRIPDGTHPIGTRVITPQEARDAGFDVVPRQEKDGFTWDDPEVADAPGDAPTGDPSAAPFTASERAWLTANGWTVLTIETCPPSVAVRDASGRVQTIEAARTATPGEAT